VKIFWRTKTRKKLSIGVWVRVHRTTLLEMAEEGLGCLAHQTIGPMHRTSIPVKYMLSGKIKNSTPAQSSVHWTLRVQWLSRLQRAMASWHGKRSGANSVWKAWSASRWRRVLYLFWCARAEQIYVCFSNGSLGFGAINRPPNQPLNTTIHSRA
jgi:hypothetical protein